MKRVIYYQKENGDIPVEEFLVDLSVKNFKLANKIRSKILILSLGKTSPGDIKYVGDKIYELRIRDQNNISRVFYFTYSRDTIILLDGIIKKEQKLKNSDIKRAMGFKNMYLKKIGNK